MPIVMLATTRPDVNAPMDIKDKLKAVAQKYLHLPEILPHVSQLMSAGLTHVVRMLNVQLVVNVPSAPAPSVMKEIH